MLTTLKSWIAARPVAAYYAMTLAISWGYWMTLLVQGKRVGPGSEVSHFPGLLGPFLAAVILTAYLNGWPGVRELFGRMTRWRTAWPWGLAVAMAPLPLAILVMVALHFSGIPLPSWHDFQVFPGLPAGLPLWAVVLLVFLVNGYGEEVGWRGFVMEKWLTRYGRFGTTVRVAAHSRRRSNRKIAPTSRDSPMTCTLSTAGHAHSVCMKVRTEPTLASVLTSQI